MIHHKDRASFGSDLVKNVDIVELAVGDVDEGGSVECVEIDQVRMRWMA